MPDMHFPTLLSPFELAGKRVRNRVIMGSMHTGLEDRARDYPALAEYFATRARGGVGLIVTGGIAPNRAGWIKPFAGKLACGREVARHRLITQAVQAQGARICMQILHSGRYGYHPLIVSSTNVRASINRFRPRALSSAGVAAQIDDFVHCAELAQEAGYDGVEIMGSEGYFINQFMAPRTNPRNDEWGGPIENRGRLALEIVRRTRLAVGANFILIFRLSGLDLVEQGSSFADVQWMLAALAEAGATLINTGIGWHEARVPTIAGMVPRAAFAFVTERMRRVSRLPVVVTNRINDPAVAEGLLRDGVADFVSMARPLLADPDWVNKAASARADEINTCIACNQACLDKVFRNRKASCLVNPRAGRETQLILAPAEMTRRIAVIGAGPAGLACALACAERGHSVTLFEREAEIGGQFRYAREVPGKEEFAQTLRYFRVRLPRARVALRLGVHARARDLMGQGFDQIVIATGVKARVASIPGIEHPSVISYPDLLSGKRRAGERVAIIGAGGIGFDVAVYLTGTRTSDPAESLQDFQREWGIDPQLGTAGGLLAVQRQPPQRKIWLLQRKPGKPGSGLGATTGWIHRRTLQQRGVVMRGGVSYEAIDDAGLHLRCDDQSEVLAVDNVVVCAGQQPEVALLNELAAAGIAAKVIGGALLAAELDAERAIREGTELAASL